MKKALLLLLALASVLLTGCGQTADPVEEAWYADLPWGEDWTCLLLTGFELEPEAGKAALRDLLSACDWTPAEAARRPDCLHEIRLWTGEDGPLTLGITQEGEVWWKDALWRTGDGAGFRQACLDLAKTGVSTSSAPPLTYSCGPEALTARVGSTYTWNHITRAGEELFCDHDVFRSYETHPWLDGTYPVLRAEGDVLLSFSGREPDSLRLALFCEYGSIPVELRGLTFTPYAGANTYALSLRWDRRERGGYGGVTYILLIEGACASALPETGGGLTVSLPEADAWGCSFTLENREGPEFQLMPATSSISPAWPLFRRTDFGGWEWVKPRRYWENEYWVCPKEGSLTLGLDWSRDVGTLGPGEYALLLHGYFTSREGAETWETVYLPLRFTLGEDALPGPPGPPTPAPEPKGFSAELTRLSPHRWVQRITVATGEYVRDGDFALFRLGEDGTLTYIRPLFTLSQLLTHPVPYSGRPLEADVDLAAKYGPLEAGDYVLRRRLYRLEEGEWPGLHTFDRSWRTIPEDRLVYLDTPFTLEGPLAPASQEVEPAAEFYAGEETELPITVQNGEFASDHCRFSLLNRGEEPITFDSADGTLYYLEAGEEWLPLALQRHAASGLIPVEIPAGGSVEVSRYFRAGLQYPPLAPGVYRLVLHPTLGNNYKRRYVLAVEFTIRENGMGFYAGS